MSCTEILSNSFSSSSLRSASCKSFRVLRIRGSNRSQSWPSISPPHPTIIADFRLALTKRQWLCYCIQQLLSMLHLMIGGFNHVHLAEDRFEPYGRPFC